jgi:hypothetical protein
VRVRVTKALNNITWYISLLLTVVIAYSCAAWQKLHEMYETMVVNIPCVGKNEGPKSKDIREIEAMAVMTVMESSKGTNSNAVQFDTDATTLGIDNRCTAGISDKKGHFISSLIPGQKVIKGFHGSKATEVMSGTIQWQWLDDNGLEHTFTIPGSYYVPEGRCRLLSPQHWAQCQTRATGLKAWEITDHKGCTLYWEGGSKQLTILLGDKDNVATMRLTPGYKNSTPSAIMRHPTMIMTPL